MAETLLPIESTFTVTNIAISPMKKGILLVKDCLGYIMYHVVLRSPRSEINLAHIRSGIYEIELIIGQSKYSQNIYKKS